MPNPARHLYEFDNFRLDAENPGLWCEGNLISVPPKILETLILLVEAQGEIVTRDELLDKVWKETFVEEGNINYTISQLRKILGEKNLVKTIPKRGYRFLGKIERISINPNSEITESPIEVVTQISKSLTNEIQNKFRWTVLAAFLLGIMFVTIFAFRSNKVAISNSSNEQRTDETRPETVEALHAYTRGKMFLDDRDTENREAKAIEEFQRAITLDPTLAIAHAGLAEGLTVSAGKFSGKKAENYYAKARASVGKALSLDENLAEAYLTRGLIRRNADWDWAGAEVDFRRAVELKPNNALGHIRYSHLLSPLGRQDEALAEFNKAILLDPVSETVLSSRFAILEGRGEYDEALQKAEEFLSVNPDNTFAFRAQGTFLYHRGEYARVIEIGEKILAKNPKRISFIWLSLLAAAYHKSNQPERGDELLRQLEAQSVNNSKSSYSLAMNYAENGRSDEAIAALNKCFEDHEERLAWIKVEPRFANLRDNVAFQAIIKKMNL